MYIKLLSSTDDRIDAWMHSRPSLVREDVDLNELEKMPFSLHSLCRYTFKVEVARVILDLIAQFTKCIWSQTSRITPVADVVLDFIPSENCKSVVNLKKAKEDAVNLTQDVARLREPIFSRIGFSFSMDKRTLIGFLKSLERFQPELYSFYGTEFLRVIGMTESEFDSCPFGEVVDPTLTPEYFSNQSTKEGLRYIEGISEDSYNFISQMSRHTEVVILSSLWTKSLDELDGMIMADRIPYYFFISQRAYKTQILSHRACWIADWNNWSERVSAYFKTPDEIKSILPCKGCGSDCKYLHDLQARIDGNDPNLPCPIAVNNPDLIAERVKLEGVNALTVAYQEIMNSDINI